MNSKLGIRVGSSMIGALFRVPMTVLSTIVLNEFMLNSEIDFIQYLVSLQKKPRPKLVWLMSLTWVNVYQVEKGSFIDIPKQIWI